MRTGQPRTLDALRTVLGILLVPALWPLTFIGVAILSPKAFDPLLGGLQDVLYFPAIIWLLTILGVTLGVAKMFRLRKTNALFLMTGIGCAVVLSAAFGLYGAWGDYRSIGQPGLIYPDHFDLAGEVKSFAKFAAFSSAITLITALAFLLLGGFRLFKSQSI